MGSNPTGRTLDGLKQGDASALLEAVKPAPAKIVLLLASDRRAILTGAASRPYSLTEESQDANLKVGVQFTVGAPAMRHANSLPVTPNLIAHRKELAQDGGYPTPKWIEFSETLLNEGYTVEVYYAQQTVSKYVTVSKGGRDFLVRFSNHPPNVRREANADCDFFVGKTNFTWTTTKDALAAVRKHFAPVEI